jgi:NAD(P)-dependent dehydrogenase (short-subunit alcohol dehydrogenase family)
MPDLVCLITGGNAGIGRAAATQLARQGARVVIACRSHKRGEEAVALIREQSGSGSVSLLVMDLSSRRSIASGCEAFRSLHDRLDVLVHNAADFDIGRKAPVRSEDGVETVWATNHVGPVLLTRQLGRELSRSAQGRVVTVASKGLVMHPFLRVSLSDPELQTGGYRVDKAYYQSKLAQVMYTTWLADRLRETRITANCVRVTNVRVDLDRYPDLSPLAKRMYAAKSRFSISPEEMAETYVWLALSDEVTGTTGGYFDERRRRVSPGRYAGDPEQVRRVMELTERYVPGVLSAPIGAV